MPRQLEIKPFSMKRLACACVNFRLETHIENGIIISAILSLYANRWSIEVFFRSLPLISVSFARRKTLQECGSFFRCSLPKLHRRRAHLGLRWRVSLLQKLCFTGSLCSKFFFAVTGWFCAFSGICSFIDTDKNSYPWQEKCPAAKVQFYNFRHEKLDYWSSEIRENERMNQIFSIISIRYIDRCAIVSIMEACRWYMC